MKILIIEDEKPNFDHLHSLLREIMPEAEIEGPLKNISQVKSRLIGENDIDLILSDIRLQDGLVFDAFDSLKLETSVIMTTAYGEFALKAFKYNSVDYLMKPIDIEELRKAIGKAMRLRQPLNDLRKLTSDGGKTYRRRFLIQSSGVYSIVKCENIAAIILDGGIISIYDNSGHRHNIDATMDELESQLNPEMFFRINRQCIISPDSVKVIRKLFGRRLEVVLSNIPDMRLQVSKDRVADFKAWLDR